MSRPWKFVKPKLTPWVRPRAEGDTAGVLHSNNKTNPHWSGAVITAPPFGTIFQSITGSFSVPEAYPPNEAPAGTYIVSIWIGIDGYTDLTVLQCGFDVSCTVANNVVGNPIVTPWFQWAPGAIAAIENESFPVALGNTVSVTMCRGADQGSAVVSFSNTSTNMTTGFQSYPALFPTIFEGQNVEWIVEDPVLGPADIYIPFPDFSLVGFHDCLATTGLSFNSNYGEEDLSSPNVLYLNMLQDGTTLATTAPGNSEEFLVFYTGPP